MRISKLDLFMELLVLAARTFSTISSVLIQMHYTHKKNYTQTTLHTNNPTHKQPYTQTTLYTNNLSLNLLCLFRIYTT